MERVFVCEEYFIYYRDEIKWNLCNIICKDILKFLKIILYISVGDMFIFVYFFIEDKYVSGSLIWDGRWEF